MKGHIYQRIWMKQMKNRFLLFPHISTIKGDVTIISCTMAYELTGPARRDNRSLGTFLQDD